MDFFKNITSAFKTAGDAVQSAVGVVAEKNRKTALQNRLRTVIHCEEKAAERAYLALGRYYYNSLRDAANTVTEPYCVDIDASEQRMEAAIQKLEALCHEQEEEENVKEISLQDVQENVPPVSQTMAEETVPEGFIDEAVETAEPAAEVSKETDASEELPYV